MSALSTLDLATGSRGGRPGGPSSPICEHVHPVHPCMSHCVGVLPERPADMGTLESPLCVPARLHFAVSVVHLQTNCSNNLPGSVLLRPVQVLFLEVSDCLKAYCLITHVLAGALGAKGRTGYTHTSLPEPSSERTSGGKSPSETEGGKDTTPSSSAIAPGLLHRGRLCDHTQFGPRGCHPKAPPLRGKQAKLGHAMLAQLGPAGPAGPGRAGPAQPNRPINHSISQSINQWPDYMHEQLKTYTT